MAEMTAIKVTLILPLTDNEGHPFDLNTWTWWSDALMNLVSGFTDLGVATGWWRGHADRNRVLTIVVRSGEEVDSIRRLLREAKARFRQEAMYLEYHPVMFEEVT